MLPKQANDSLTLTDGAQMTARKIPKSYVSVTGGFASRKAERLVEFESLLEKDCYIQFDANNEISHFEEQPIRIPVSTKNKSGKSTNTSYVPDVLVHFHPDSNGSLRNPILGEIKTTTDLIKNKKKYEAKFEAANELAKKNGWEFRTFTEKDIRTPDLGFNKFLREYHHITPDAAAISAVIYGLSELGCQATYSQLTQALVSKGEDLLLTIPVIWHLVATERIHIDRTQPISDQIVLSLP